MARAQPERGRPGRKARCQAHPRRKAHHRCPTSPGDPAGAGGGGAGGSRKRAPREGDREEINGDQAQADAEICLAQGGSSITARDAGFLSKGHGHPDRQSAGCSPVMSMSTVAYWNQLSAANDGQWRWVGGLEGTVQAFILSLDAIPSPSPGSPASCPAPTQAPSAPPCTASPGRCSSSGAVFTTRPSGFGWRRDTLALGPCQGLSRLPESLCWKTSLSPTINKEA